MAKGLPAEEHIKDELKVGFTCLGCNGNYIQFTTGYTQEDLMYI